RARWYRGAAGTGGRIEEIELDIVGDEEARRAVRALLFRPGPCSLCSWLIPSHWPSSSAGTPPAPDLLMRRSPYETDQGSARRTLSRPAHAHRPERHCGSRGGDGHGGAARRPCAAPAALARDHEESRGGRACAAGDVMHKVLLTTPRFFAFEAMIREHLAEHGC